MLKNKIISSYKDNFCKKYQSKIYEFIKEKLHELNSLEQSNNQLYGKIAKVNHNVFNDALPVICVKYPVEYEKNCRSVESKMNEKINETIKDKLFIQSDNLLLLAKESLIVTYDKTFDQIKDITKDHIEKLASELTQPFSNESIKLLERIDKFLKEKQSELDAISLRLQKTEKMNKAFSQIVTKTAQFKEVTEWQKDRQSSQDSEHNNSYAMGRDNPTP